MKRIIWIMFFLIAGAGLAFAQTLDTLENLSHIDYEPFLKQQGLSEAEIAQITQLFNQTNSAKKEAQLELNVNKAQLEKLLFKLDVDMAEVEKILADSHKYRLKSELAQVELYVKVRQILGKERWAALIQYLKNYMNQEGGMDAKGRKFNSRPPAYR